jgi:hypothetical protein
MANQGAIFDAEAVRYIFDGGANLITVFLDALRTGDIRLLYHEKSRILEDDDVNAALSTHSDSIWLKSNVDIRRLSYSQVRQLPANEIAPVDRNWIESAILCSTQNCCFVSGETMSMSMSKEQICANLGAQYRRVENYF